jgi:hypothetical protein
MHEHAIVPATPQQFFQESTPPRRVHEYRIAAMLACDVDGVDDCTLMALQISLALLPVLTCAPSKFLQQRIFVPTYR